VAHLYPLGGSEYARETEVRPMIQFRIRWTACGKEQVSEFPAASASDARRAFDAYKLPGVRIVSVESIEPDAGAPALPDRPPDSPRGPLTAHREIEREDDDE
jgi:hypothetical protein